MKIDQIIFKTTIRAGEKRAKAIEEMIELHLQPRPKWMSPFLYRWMIKHLLILNEEAHQ